MISLVIPTISRTREYTTALVKNIREIYPNEDRIFVASPKDVASYDQKPEMSLPELSDTGALSLCSSFTDGLYTSCFISGNFLTSSNFGV